MKNLGFILLNIDHAVSGQILSSLSKLNNIIDKKIVIFNSYNNSTSTALPILHINQCKFFSGDVVVFDVIGLLIATSCYKLKNIYYYAYNIPWAIDYTTDYKFWSRLFDNDRVKIVAQNQEIYEIFDQVWKKPIVSAQEILSNEFIEIIR